MKLERIAEWEYRITGNPDFEDLTFITKALFNEMSHYNGWDWPRNVSFAAEHYDVPVSTNEVFGIKIGSPLFSPVVLAISYPQAHS